jgi:NAD(P)-dependent dehydrogenase (short-subunit alcohol dehydrogenase family)
MGACTARLFAREGAKVVATDIDRDAVTAVANEIVAAGGEAIALRHDIASVEDWDRVVAEAVKAFGLVNVLVNNAAVHFETRLLDISPAEWDKVLKIDLGGPFLGIRAVVPEMLRSGGGAIVNLSSIASIKGSSFAHYSAAKAGVASLTRTTAIEFAKSGIRVNAVLPGLIVTNLTKDALANEQVHAMLKASTPMPRFGQPEDVAYGILYLASDEASFVTGTNLIIDGGNTAA